MSINQHNRTSSLTKVENFRLTWHLLDGLEKWNHNEKHPILGGIGARTVGLIATPGACAVDALVHLALMIGKTATGIFVTPYNKIIKNINAKYMAPRDLELESAFIHLIRTVESLFQAAVLPLVVFLDPCRAFILVNNQVGKAVAKPIILPPPPSSQLPPIDVLPQSKNDKSDNKTPRKPSNFVLPPLPLPPPNGNNNPPPPPPPPNGNNNPPQLPNAQSSSLLDQIRNFQRGGLNAVQNQENGQQNQLMNELMAQLAVIRVAANGDDDNSDNDAVSDSEWDSDDE